MNCELNMILDKVKGKFICVYNGESKVFSSKDEFEGSNMEKNCCITSIGTQDGMGLKNMKSSLDQHPASFDFNYLLNT